MAHAEHAGHAGHADDHEEHEKSDSPATSNSDILPIDRLKRMELKDVVTTSGYLSLGYAATYPLSTWATRCQYVPQHLFHNQKKMYQLFSDSWRMGNPEFFSMKELPINRNLLLGVRFSTGGVFVQHLHAYMTMLSISKIDKNFPEPDEMLPMMGLVLAAPLLYPFTVLTRQFQVGFHPHAVAGVLFNRRQFGWKGLFAGFIPNSLYMALVPTLQAVLAGPMISAFNGPHKEKVTDAKNALIHFGTGAVSGALFSPLNMVGVRMATQTAALNHSHHFHQWTKLLKEIRLQAAEGRGPSIWRGSLPLAILGGATAVISQHFDNQLPEMF